MRSPARITTISPGTSAVVGNGFMIPLTNHRRFAGEHIANALERFFGVTLLNMTNQGVDHRHAEDHQSIDP